MKASGALRQYTVVGRRLPSEAHPKPPLYKMTIYAPNEVCRLPCLVPLGHNWGIFFFFFR